MTPRPLPLIEEITVCPICGGKPGPPIFAPDITRCLSCRTLFRNPRPTQEAIAASYNEGITYARWQDDNDAFERLWVRRRDYVLQFKKEGRLLDIGCGDGRFLSAMTKAGFIGTGTELSSTGAALAEKSNSTIRVGQFTDIDFGESCFDVITLWHVLEHVPNPQAVMLKVRKLLAVDGLLIVAVPNEDHALLRSRLHLLNGQPPFGPLFAGDEVHLTHFQPLTLKRLLMKSGFKVLRFEVDDFYPNRSILNRIKISSYQIMASLFGWHPAVAMLCVCINA